MLHFNIQKGQVVLDAMSMTLKSVKEIYKDYDPDVAIRVLTYIHVVSRMDPTAPFFSADVKEIHELSKRQFFPEDEWATINWENVDKLADKYEKVYETPELRVVKIFNDKIDQIREMIKDTTPSIVGYITTSGSKGFSSNVPIITKAMQDLDSLLDAKEKLEARVRKQSAKAGKIMGGKAPSRLEAKHLKKKP